MLIYFLSILSFAGLTFGATPDPRIVGGDAIPITQAPYQVSIRMIHYDNPFGSAFFCGGSLIQNSVVLTAAHCMYDANDKLFSPSDLQVVGGHANLTIRDGSTFVSAVSSFKVHESYKNDGQNYENDIAVIKLKTNATITSNSVIQLINLPTSSYPVGSMCLISGWGTLVEEGPTSLILRGAFVQVHNRTQCNHPTYLNGLVKNSMFCAGPFAGGKDACQGDSGGPLNCNNVIYGVTSHGVGCGQPNYPGIYTDVYYYREWILKNSSVSNSLSFKMLITIVFVTVSFFSF